MKKQQVDYFSIMTEQVQCSVRAATLLDTILNSYDPGKLEDWRAEMHAIEHTGDQVRHRAMQALARDFITPIDRQNLIELVQILDDVTDAIDEVVIDLYMFNVTSLPSEISTLSHAMMQCVKSLEQAVAEFRSYKRSERLMPLLVEVNTRESEADELHITAMRTLFTSTATPMQVIAIKAIYSRLESCCDLCEHAADVIENSILNNT